MGSGVGSSMYMWCPLHRALLFYNSSLIHPPTLIELWTEPPFFILAVPLCAYLWSICILHRRALLMVLPITRTAADLLLLLLPLMVLSKAQANVF